MTNIRSAVAKLTVAALLASPAGPAFGWQTTSGTATPSAKPTAKPNVQSAPDGEWPRHYTAKSGAIVVLYQPQVGLWPDQQHMTMFAAVSYHAPNAPKPVLGTLKIEANTKVALDERLVSFSDLNITLASFPTVSKDDVKTVVAEIQDAIPHDDRIIALDRVLAMVETSAVKPKNHVGVKADPPPIFFSDKPAVLVNFDGDPIWSPIQGNELTFAVNTNWDVFEHGSHSYFLRVNESWMTASSIRGPWKPAASLPDSFNKLPDDANWKEVKAALPGKALAAPALPTVFVSTVPAELILASGAPQYTAVAGTGLMWMSNTEADVFRMGKDGVVYFLVAGRWFSSPQFAGPWTFATPTLPEDFKKIPLEHPRSRVLASVPGTRPAIEAVLLAQIPQTARVNRKDVKAPDVAYSGEPKFEPIEQTTVARAVNTDMDVIKVGDLYFLCFDGVWFRSTTAGGPWEVADSVPSEIYQIPISSPASNVTYVTVEDSDDEWVEFAAASAYTGMWVGWGCAMWGSGWYYPPDHYGGGGYYGFYPTYGYGAHYNPWTGAYSRGAAVYGPYGGAGYASRYNARTGTYSRGAMAYGPAGARGAVSAWNPRTGTAAQTRQGSGVYGSWGATSVQRGDSWANTARVTNRATGTTTRATHGSGGGGAVTRNPRGPGGGGVARTGGGDVYAGRDGNVYRNQNGSWQKYDSGGWSHAQRSGASATTLTNDTRNQLNQDRYSRGDGMQRTRDAGSIRSSGGYHGSGSYRPSGGGMRTGGGGGGMRSGGGGMRGGGGGGRR